MKFIKYFNILILLILSGCCIDCSNTKKEFEDIQAQNVELISQAKNNAKWIDQKVSFYGEKEVLERARESAVLTARICDYLIQVCPSEMTDSGRKLIAEFDTKYDSPRTIKLQLSKLIFLISSLGGASILLYALWIIILQPKKQQLDNAKRLIEQAPEQANSIIAAAKVAIEKYNLELQSTNFELENRAQQLERRQDNATASLVEKTAYLAELKQQIFTLQEDITRLEKARDALNGSF